MKRLQVIESRTQPDNTNVLWLNLENDVIYRFSESGWIPVKADESITENAKCVTHYELVELKNSKELIPGTFYRITDYDTSYLTENNPSNARDLGYGTIFDIIVLAISNDKLREEASICLPKNGNTTLASRKLSAWKIWYKLDNAREYDWYSSSAKGLIYRMIDEYNNDVYYDFVNIGVKSSNIGILDSREGILKYIPSLSMYFFVNYENGVRVLTNTELSRFQKISDILYTFGGHFNNAAEQRWICKNNTIKYLAGGTCSILPVSLLGTSTGNIINLLAPNSDITISGAKGNTISGDHSVIIGLFSNYNKIEDGTNIVLLNNCKYNIVRQSNNIVLCLQSLKNNILNCAYLKISRFCRDNNFESVNNVTITDIGSSKLTNVARTIFGTQETTSNTVYPRFYNIRNYQQDINDFSNSLPVFLKVNKLKGELFQSIKTVESDTSTITYHLEDGSNVQQITYSELVTAMKCNNLIPGMCYEITDYQTTVEASHLQATGETFCITLRAKSDHELEEEAVAIRRRNATAFLNWKVWYKPLYNSHFTFVKETTPGFKGIIYRMIDGYNNDLPYDFYSVKIKGDYINSRFFRTLVNNDDYYFTFAASDNGDILPGVNALQDIGPKIYDNKWIYPNIITFNIGSIFVTSEGAGIDFHNNTFDYTRLFSEFASSLDCVCISAAPYVFQNYIEIQAFLTFGASTTISGNYIRNNKPLSFLYLINSFSRNICINTSGGYNNCSNNIFENVISSTEGLPSVVDVHECSIRNTNIRGNIRGTMRKCIIENCFFYGIESSETVSTNIPITNYIIRSIINTEDPVIVSTVNSPDVIEVIPTSKNANGYAEINKSDLIDLLYPSTPETTE